VIAHATLAADRAAQFAILLKNPPGDRIGAAFDECLCVESH
jgi:hypothetical protein